MGTSLVALQCGRPVFNSWVGMICWRRDRLPTPVFLGFPGGSDGIESACNSGYLDSIPGSGRFPGKGIGKPLQYSSLENSMDRGAWQASDHVVTKSRTELRDFHFLFILLMTSCYWKLNSNSLCTSTPIYNPYSLSSLLSPCFQFECFLSHACTSCLTQE